MALEARGDGSSVVGGMEQGEDDDFILDIDLLQAHGINVADIKKLKTAGICTVRGVQMITKKKLCNIKGLSEAKVDKIKEAILKLQGEGGGVGFITALQVVTSSFCAKNQGNQLLPAVKLDSSGPRCKLAKGIKDVFKCGRRVNLST